MRRAVLAATLATAIGCHHPSNYAPSQVKAIVLSIAPTHIPADGVSRATIVATIDPDAEAAFKILTFKTTAGKFFPSSGGNGQEAELTVDSTGKATALLQSDPGFTAATVTVTTNGISVAQSVPFDSVAAADVFTLSSAASTIPADGFSDVLITLESKKTLSTPEQRVVTFQTSAGTLSVAGASDPTGAPTGTLVKAIADGNGIASVRLASSKQLLTARVTATLLTFSQAVDVTFGPASPSATVQVSAEPSTLAADNASVTRVVATVANNLPPGRRSVQFTTSIGTFIGPNPVEADASNRAVILLKSDTAGNAIVSATADGNRADTTVVMKPALPETIFVSPAQPRVSASNTASVLINVKLLRSVGQVSESTQVSFVALDPSGQKVGTFSNITLSKAGDVSATYFPGTTAYRGAVTITATVAGSPAVGKADVVIIDP